MTKLFISYKKSSTNETVANELYEVLKPKYEDKTSKESNVFLDRREINGGEEWLATIYDAISVSDVLILLVTADATSRWVQREIDYARGCRINILPVVVFENDLVIQTGKAKDNATEVLEVLALTNFHYVRALRNVRYEDRYNETIEAINRLAPKTRNMQKMFIDRLDVRWKKEDMLNPALKRADTYVEQSEFVYDADGVNPHNAHIFLASGSITDLEGVDVIVNSENIYMQMQRVFAPISVSREIRLMGARGDWKNVFIEEDTVQNELNQEVFNRRNKIPVQQCDVFVTAAGDPSSELAKRKFRFIYHVAVVSASRTGEVKLEGNDDGAQIVQACVTNCLAELKTYNIAHPDTPIKRIVFPLLGAGNAGLEVEFSAQSIIEAIKKWLKRNTVPALEGIHINAYRNCDVSVVLNVMKESKLRYVHGMKPLED